MLRPFARARTSFAAVQIARELDPLGDLRQRGARRLALIARAVLAPIAGLVAAIAGAVFVVLLPICGIASIAEGIARSCWRSTCDMVSQASRDTASHY